MIRDYVILYMYTDKSALCPGKSVLLLYSENLLVHGLHNTHLCHWNEYVWFYVFIIVYRGTDCMATFTYAHRNLRECLRHDISSEFLSLMLHGHLYKALQWNPAQRTPLKTDTHDITDSSESPDRFYIDFNNS